jgi:tetratricopeptide (TPR) repeat protein
MIVLLMALLLAQGNPSTDAQRLNEVQQLMDSGRCAEAIPILKALVARHPEAPTLQYGLGRCYFQAGDYTNAVSTLRVVAREMPKVAEVHFFLGSALGLSGNTAEAIQELRIAMELDPEFEPAFRAYGMFRVGSGASSQDARDALEAALRLDPKDARAHYWLGKYYQGWGDTDHARQCFERAYQLDPADLPTRLGLGQTLLADGEFDAALTQFDAILRREPGLVPAMLGRARALYNKGEIEAALAPAEAAQKGAHAFEDQSGAEWLLSRIYLDLGRDADAKAAELRLNHLQETLGADVARLRELNDQAERFKAAGRPDKVVEAMEAFLKIRETPGAQITLGDAFLALGRMAEAEGCYIRASQIGPLTDSLKERLRKVRELRARQ